MAKCTCRKDIICGGCGEPVYQAHGHAVDSEGEVSSNRWPEQYEECSVHLNGYIYYLLETAVDLAYDITKNQYSIMDEETILFAKQFLEETEKFRKDKAWIDKLSRISKESKNE
jgi:hypothetical protein